MMIRKGTKVWVSGDESVGIPGYAAKVLKVNRRVRGFQYVLVESEYGEKDEVLMEQLRRQDDNGGY